MGVRRRASDVVASVRFRRRLQVISLGRLLARRRMACKRTPLLGGLEELLKGDGIGGLIDSIGAYKNDHTLISWLNFQLSGEKPEGFNAKYEDVLQLAVNKGYKDDIGFPDVARAARELAGPITAKADTTKIKQEGFDAGYKKAQAEFAASLGQPQAGAGGISFEAAPEKGARPQTIREKLDAAMQDPSILQLMTTGGMTQ